MHKKQRIVLAVCIVLLVGGVLTYLVWKQNNSQPSHAITGRIQVAAEHLQTPWGLAFLPDGELLVTERPGSLKRIGKNYQTYTIEGVEHTSEGGLLGIALHPGFSENHWLYLYLTTKKDGSLINRVERYKYQSDRLSDKKVLLDNIPGSQNHDGGRLAFGPEGALYITTGDAGNANAAQDTESLAGKILRLNDDGSVPSDNPFHSAVYSYGHRNPQGLAWDNQGRLWSTEHGPSGLQSGFDELNLIKKGANYGWPVIKGEESRPDMQSPVIQSGQHDTWAPAGLAYFEGALYFGGLRGEALYQAAILPDTTVDLKKYEQGTYGRLRTTATGPDGFLYLTTSNTDGRGTPGASDDKILRLSPEAFTKN